MRGTVRELREIILPELRRAAEAGLKVSDASVLRRWIRETRKRRGTV